jgi:hypothetical protein
MRYGTPVYQRSYNKRYSPLRGRKILQEQTGFFKEATRTLGLGSLYGDLWSETGLGLNRQTKTKLEGNAVLADFMNRYQGTTKQNIKFTDDNHIHIGQSPFNLHKVTKKGNAYYVTTHNAILKQSSVPLKVYATDENELISKLELIFTNPTARAKLEYHKPNFPFITSPMQLIPFTDYRNYVVLNDSKIMPNLYLQEFEAGNNYAKINEFDSALGAVSVSQINHHIAGSNINHYSEKKNGEAFTTVADEFGIRLNNMTEHLLSSNVTDELMGNIVNMYDTQKRLLPEQRGQLVQKLREDYVYNLHGKGSVNNRQRSHAPANYTYDPAIDSLWKQFQYSSNPFRGGRYHRDIPFSLEQTLLAFYTPTVSGKRTCQYDINPERFKKEIQKVKVTPEDRQFMATYGRKIFGTYVTLKMLSDEIALIDLKDTKNADYNHKKWADLNALQDELFESAGDMRDFLRTHSTGFGQTKESVGKKIPDFADNPNKQKLEHIVFNKDEFVKYTKDSLLWHVKDYTYFENFMGWQFREDIGGLLPEKFMNNVYKKTMPRIIPDVVTTMLIEGLDNVSRDLKYLETTCERDTNGVGRFKSMMDKFKFGDINGFKEALAWNKNHLLRGLETEKNFPTPKRQALQSEGIIMDKPYFPPMKRVYLGENQGFFTTNAPTKRITYQYMKKMSTNFIDFMHLCGIHFKKIQTEMKQKNITDMYQTNSMKQFDILLRETAKAMATDYIHDKRTVYSVLKPEEQTRLHFEIHKKMYHFLQLNANLSALLANNPEVVYS